MILIVSCPYGNLESSRIYIYIVVFCKILNTKKLKCFSLRVSLCLFRLVRFCVCNCFLSLFYKSHKVNIDFKSLYSVSFHVPSRQKGNLESSQLRFTCAKLTIRKPRKRCEVYSITVCSDVLVYCWLWTSKC